MINIAPRTGENQATDKGEYKKIYSLSNHKVNLFGSPAVFLHFVLVIKLLCDY